MDREYISQHNVIERYLSGRLTEEELVAFEERCLWCQETLDDLDVAERLRDGLRGAKAAQTATSARGPVARLFLSPQWAAAASVMLVVSLATTGYLLNQDPSSPQGLATAQVYSIEATRGSDAPSAIVRVAPEDRWVVLLVYPELGRHNSYMAALQRSDEAQPVWQIDYIPPGTTDSLALSVPATLLKPGDYRLRISGRNGSPPGDTVGEVVFRVAPPL
jgi:hypothetical protein